MSFDIPEQILEYYEEKRRDLPKATNSLVSTLLHQLDCAIIARDNHGGPQEAVDTAFQAVLDHPENRYTSEVLSYRIRQVHYH
jgi:hypothetical protein